MSFRPENYYSFFVYDSEEKNLPNQFIQSACDEENCECGDNTKNEFFDVPKVVLFNIDYKKEGPIYLTYYASIIGTKEDKTKISGNLLIQPKGSGKDDLAGNKVCTLGGLDNFWRSATNLEFLGDKSYLAISQACPLRYCIFKNLLLCYGVPNHTFTCCPYQDTFLAEWNSGGFMSDVTIRETLDICSQQQFLAQDCIFNQPPVHGAWNLVFYNCQNAQAKSYDDQSGQYTIVSKDQVPISSQNMEKPPLLIFENNTYFLLLNGKKVNMDYVIDPGADLFLKNDNILDPETGTDITSLLDTSNENIIIPAGIYYITKTITIRSNLIGIGLPIIRFHSNSKINFQKEGGCLSSLLFDNYGSNDCLLEIQSNNVSLFDVFFRNGGPIDNPQINNTMLLITGNNAYLNNLWIWRADHGIHGTFENSETKKAYEYCPAKHGLIVNGNDCVSIGLAVEHFDEINTIWNGDYGSCVFFQNEFPYFVKSFPYPSLSIENNFQGYGMGFYCYFRDYNVTVQEAILTNPQKKVHIDYAFTVYLNDGGNTGTKSEIQCVLRNNGKEYGPASIKNTQGKPQILALYDQQGTSPSIAPSSSNPSNIWIGYLILGIIILLLLIIIFYLLYRRMKKKQ